MVQEIGISDIFHYIQDVDCSHAPHQPRPDRDAGCGCLHRVRRKKELIMEPIVIIAILFLLGRGKKAETPAAAPSRGISPSVTPPLPSELLPPDTSSTMTPTFLDPAGTGGTQGSFGSTYRGVQAVGRRGGSGKVDKSAMVRPPSAPPSPVYRAPSTPRVAPQTPPTIPVQSGTPIAPAPKTVVPVNRNPAGEIPSVAETVASGGIPDFCRKEYMPFLMQPCPGTSVVPAMRQGPPPPGTWVVTGPLVRGAQRSRAQPSCPDASPSAGREGIFYMIAGSDEWNAICPPSTTAPEI